MKFHRVSINKLPGASSNAETLLVLVNRIFMEESLGFEIKGLKRPEKWQLFSRRMKADKTKVKDVGCK